MSIHLQKRLMAMIFVVVFGGLASTPAARAQQIDTGALTESAHLLSQFSRSMSQSTVIVPNIPSWSIKWECGYKCLGALCIWNLKAKGSEDFEWFKPVLDQRARQIQRNAEEFIFRFNAGLQDWKSTIAPTDAAFASAIQRLDVVSNQIKAGQGPTEAQFLEVVAALGTLTSQLDQGRHMLERTATLLGDHLVAASAARVDQQNWEASVIGRVNGIANSLKREISQQPCAGDAVDQVNRLQAVSLAMVQVINNYVNMIQTQGEEADRAMKVVLGTMISFETRYRDLTARVETTQLAPLGSVIQTIRLDVARQGWADFVGAVTRAGR